MSGAMEFGRQHAVVTLRRFMDNRTFALTRIRQLLVYVVFTC